MIIARSIDELRQALSTSQRPAFVPTMGNLHDGHIQLVARAKPLGDCTVVSIFVNRLQFLPHEDFDSYPRTWEADCAKLHAAGCDVVFAPRETDLYPEPQTVKVHADPALGDILEGAFRPGFFTGVSTVVMKLFMAVFAGKVQGVAVFGKKDYQQLMVIRNMCRQFQLPVEILAHETVRAEDGLALSSRNVYLQSHERAEAPQLYAALRLVQQRLRAGELDTNKLGNEAANALQSRGWQVDYIAIRRQRDLNKPTPQDLAAAEPLVALAAAKLGATRLIDNLEL